MGVYHGGSIGDRTPGNVPETVALIGNWDVVPAEQQLLQAGSTCIERCPAEVRAVKGLMRDRFPAWILVGEGPNESVVESILHAGLEMSSALRMALLGPPGDWRRCERWVRRGCHVYMSRSSSLERCLTSLATSSANGVVVVDQAFQRQSLAEARRIQAPADLTQREEQVLTLLCLGRRNRDIASELHIGEHTVEFHIRQVLAKLGARNRVEAVNRALALGLQPKAWRSRGSRS